MNEVTREVNRMVTQFPETVIIRRRPIWVVPQDANEHTLSVFWLCNFYCSHPTSVCGTDEDLVVGIRATDVVARKGKYYTTAISISNFDANTAAI